jgi:inorganic triphosphatase YgiF
MQTSEIFQALGQDGFAGLVRSISIGKLRTYQLYEALKARAHLPKLNVEGLRRVTPRFWERIGQGDEALASDLAQAILVSHLDMIIDVLDFLGVPNRDGFFEKDLDASEWLKEGWQQRVFEKFQSKYPRPALLFYLNHLAMELAQAEELFLPAEAEQK